MFRKPLVRFPLMVRKINFRDEVLNSVTTVHARRTCEHNGDQDLSFSDGKDPLFLAQMHDHPQGHLEADT